MRNNSRILLLLAVLLGAGAVVIKRHSQPTAATTLRTHQKVIRLKPQCNSDGCRGAYTYQSGNTWFVYYTMLGQPESPDYVAYMNSRSELPSGGVWTRAASAPQAEDIEVEQEIEVAQNEQGEPQETTEGVAKAQGEADVGPVSEGSAAGLEPPEATSAGTEAPGASGIAEPITDGISTTDAAPTAGDSSGGGNSGRE